MTDVEQIQWVEKVVRLSSLRPYEKNPRTVTDEQFARLLASLRADGYHSRIKATDDGRVIGGHLRLRALRELGLTEVPILVPSRALTDQEFERVLLTDNHNNGVFDMDALANNFDLDFLQGIGLHEVTNIAPMDDGGTQPGRAMVKCPGCEHVFPTKGNKYVPD